MMPDAMITPAAGWGSRRLRLRNRIAAGGLSTHAAPPLHGVLIYLNICTHDWLALMTASRAGARCINLCCCCWSGGPADDPRSHPPVQHQQHLYDWPHRPPHDRLYQLLSLHVANGSGDLPACGSRDEGPAIAPRPFPVG